MSQQALVQAQQKTAGSASTKGSILQRAAVVPAITPVHHTLLQRCSGGIECEECRQKRLEREGMIQRAAVNATPVNEVPPIVHEVLSSPGQALDAGTRAFMEPRFGYDFSEVRVHTDARAAESACAVNALAYTMGRDVVFNERQYAPRTSDGRRLLAHELTHVVQQRSDALQSKLTIGEPGDTYEQEADRVADTLTKNIGHAASHEAPSIEGERPMLTPVQAPLVQRQSQDEAGRGPTTADTECPGYERNELQGSHTEAGHLDRDVFMLAPGRLLIADFGVDWRHVKRSTADDPILQSWLDTFETDDSYRLEIIGYSDCVGVEGRNTQLRQSRALRVEGLLGHSARSRVTFRGMAALGDYVADNQSVAGRARNRGVVIEFHQELTMEPEEITVTPKRCGPDSTQWLVDQMNTNRNHPVIRVSREDQWPTYTPFFNIGWNIGFLQDFRDLVRAGGPWDFKSNQQRWRVQAGQSCPAHDCDRTVTLCGRCFNYDVPGNIHYGWIGRQAGLRAWFLHNRAAAAQAGGVDDPRDVVAIDVGIDMADDGTTLCDELRRHGDELNLDRTDGCSICSTSL